MLACKKPGRKRAMRQNAQTAIEIIGIAVVLFALLLLVLLTTFNRNMQTQNLMEINHNIIQCSEVSSTVGRMFNNQATTRETVTIARATSFNRVEGNPGGLKVGSVTCSYVGNVQLSTGEKDTDIAGAGNVGTTIGIGSWCFEKEPDTNAVITGGECS